MAQKFPSSKVAVIHDKSSWGQGTALLIAENLQRKGFKADVLSLNSGEQDFTALVTRLKRDAYDIVMPSMFMREAGLLVRQIGAAGYTPKIIGTASPAFPDFVAVAGPAREGVYYTTAHVSDAGHAMLAKLGTANNASIYNAQSYAAGQVLAQALARAGPQPGALLQDIHSQSFDTVLGPLRFDAKGDIADMKFDIMQYRGGKPVRVVQ